MSKFRWGDAEDDEDVLPEPTTTGPNEKGIVTKTEYLHNSKGEAVKKTTTIQLVKVKTRVYEVTAERRKWPKYGLAANGNEGVTMQSVDEIMFERTNLQKKNDLEGKKVENTLLKIPPHPHLLGIPQSQTSRLPQLQISHLAQKQRQGEKSLTEMLAEKRRHRELMRAQGLLEPVQEAPKEDELRQGGGGGGGNKYVPPSRKAGAPALSRDSDPSLRVSNLSENVTDHDLKTLFSSFGDVSRVYIAKDRTTQEHRGFAFVNFRNRMHAEEAMHALNGFGFDNMILHVEFAQPREQRQ